MVDDANGPWVKELPSTLWAIRTTIHSSTRDTLFNLAFKLDAVIPIEVGINLLRVAHFDPQKNKTSIRANLDLLDKVKEDVSLKAAAKQMQMA